MHTSASNARWEHSGQGTFSSTPINLSQVRPSFLLVVSFLAWAIHIAWLNGSAQMDDACAAVWDRMRKCGLLKILPY